MFYVFLQIIYKEFSSFFRTGLVYFTAGAYLLLSMLTTFYMGTFFEIDNTRLSSFFYFQCDIFALLIPALTMRLWAEENKSGTAEFLLTQPLRYGTVVLGKFCAAWGFCLMLLLMTAPFWIYVNSFYPLDNLNILSAYFACLLVSGCFCALGCCISAFSRSPITAYIVSVLAGWAVIVSRPDRLIYWLKIPENSVADLALALNFDKHYADFISGQPGWDNLFYFTLLIIFPLFINWLIIFTKNRMQTLLAAGFLLTAFVFFNLGGGLLFAGSKADMTADRRFTLSQSAKDIARTLQTPVYIRVYLSSVLGSENNAMGQYAQYVLRMLHKFQTAASGNINIQIINPEPYSKAAQNAEAAGIRTFSGQGGDKLYFGLEAVNKDGRQAVIPFFDRRRNNMLEQDITRILHKLSSHSEKTVDIVAPDLPQFYNGNFAALLRSTYNVRRLSQYIAQIPGDTDVLIVALTSGIPKSFAYALDQYLLRGGNILLLLDNSAEWLPSTAKVPEMNDFLMQTGIFLLPDILVGSDLTAAEATAEGMKKHYPLWANLNRNNFNQNQALTADLHTLRMRSPGGLVIADSESYKVTPLLSIKENTFSIPSQLAKLASADNPGKLIYTPHQSFVLAAISEGKYTSSFSEGYYTGLDTARKLLPFLAASVNPGRLAVISDTDIADDLLWAPAHRKVAADIVPMADNGLFLLRIVDYLAGNKKLTELPRRNRYLGDETPGSVLYSRADTDFRPEYMTVDIALQKAQKELERYRQELHIENSASAVAVVSRMEEVKKADCRT